MSNIKLFAIYTQEPHLRDMLFPAAAALALSACNSGVPLTTQWTLRSYDLGTADVAPLRIAVRAPDWLEPTPEKARVVAGYWRDDEAPAKRALTIRLARAVHGEDAPALARLGGETGGSLAIFEADRRDLAAIRAAQDEGRRWAQEKAKAHGDLKLDGALYCRRGDIPQGPVLLDVFIHTDDEIGWLPLLTRHDVHRPGADESKLEAAMPPCAKTAARIDAAKGGR